MNTTHSTAFVCSKALLICLLFFPFTHLFAQSLHGTLIDSLTGAPVGYAHIYSESRDYGTITNEHGRFELNAYSPSDSFYISHVNYQHEMITTEPGDSVMIRLKPAVRILDAVVIDQEAIEIATDLYEQLKIAPLHYGKSFYRQITMIDEDPIEFAEVFYDISYKTTGIEEVKIDQARFARKRDKVFQFVNFSYHSNAVGLISDSLSSVKIPFSKVFDEYIYSISEKYIKDGDTYVRVKCTPPKITTPSDTADLYVGSEFLYNLTDRALMEWRYHIRHGFGADQFKSDTLKAKNPEHFFYLNFTTIGGKTYLDHIRVEYFFDLVADDEISRVKVFSNALIYEKNAKPHRKLYKPGLENSNIKHIRRARYRPRFWRENPVITLTPKEAAAIATFEKENAFGSYFK